MGEPGKKRRALGPRANGLFGEVRDQPAARDETGELTPGVSEISISLVQPNPAQPRRHFDEAELDELTDSIKAKGVLQAILVRPSEKGTKPAFEIIAGERRWRAAKRAGLETIPAIVREANELELLELGIIENVQRTDLNPIEEAQAYDALMKRFGKKQDDLAASVGKSRAHIANTLRLLNLSEGALKRVAAGEISAGHARAALAAPDPEELINLAIARKLSVRETEALARKATGEDSGSIKSAVAGMAPSKDVDTEALEADLSRRLGLAVSIKHRSTGGELKIKYRDLEQLDDVCRRLTAKRRS